MAEKIHKSKISTFEWGLVIGALILIDIIQIILDLVAVGVAINRIIDIIVALSLVFYLLIRGELEDPETRMRAIAIIAITFIAEEVPVLDAAPFWTGDGIYFWNLSRKRNIQAENAKKEAQKQEEMQKIENQQIKMMKIQEMRLRQQEQREAASEGLPDEDLYEEDQ